MRTFSFKEALVLFMLLMGCGILFAVSRRLSANEKLESRFTSKTQGGVCTKDSCGALDPVNDPDYNMRNITKQSILLEEHIAEENKYCISCIIKHFLHIIGLAEEATWMAGSKLKDYPHLKESVSFYNRVFDQWSSHKHDDDVKKQVLDALRGMRRQLIDAYFV